MLGRVGSKDVSWVLPVSGVNPLATDDPACPSLLHVIPRAFGAPPQVDSSLLILCRHVKWPC